MMDHTLFITLWHLFQVFQCVICLWIAFAIFPRRGAGRWVLLTSAVLQPLVYAGAWLVPRIANELHGLMGLQLISMTMGTCISLFLLGIVLFLSGQRSDANRIAELEAIIRDRT